jgi:predicted TIM-barrel fold metal-dependent hydrolase
MIDRRKILAGIGGSVLSKAAWAQAPACASPQRFIDVHCHVFNASDLPIEGFLKKVVIRGSHELNAQFVRYPEAFNILVHGMTNLLQRESPSPAAEIALVDAIDRGARAAPTKAERDRRNLELLAQLIDDIWTKKIVRGLRVGNATVINVALDQLQRLLITQVYPEFFCCGGDQDQINRLDRTDLAARILVTNRVIGRYIRWALLFTRYRFEIADDLEKFHRGRLALMTPALVDFSKWVEDDRHNSIALQIEVMSRIAHRRNAPHVHGFVGFDPLRQAIHEKTRGPDADDPLKLVRRAILEKGFVGVKLYPPMGFRPMGNAELGKNFPCYVRYGTQVCNDRTPVGRLGIGAVPGPVLDDILTRLYTWCAENNVPLMAHTATSPGVGKRADPRHWRPVLARFPDLRLNLAHFGSFTGVNDRGEPIPREDTWDWASGKLWTEDARPNVFADLGYFSELLNNKTDVLGVRDYGRRRAIENLEAFRNGFPDSANHLIYGTDWAIVGREENMGPIDLAARRSYPEQVAEALCEAGYSVAEIDAIMYRNAVRFLGLGPDQRERGTRGRLEKFYGAAGLPTAWLDGFNSVS